MNAHWNTAAARDAFKWYMSLATPTRPPAMYLALSASSADPTLGWTELAVANYSRQVLNWTYGGDVFATNSLQVDFTNLGGGSILGQAIFDAGTGGNLLFWADLDLAIGFTTGHTISYPAGIIRIGAVV